MKKLAIACLIGLVSPLIVAPLSPAQSNPNPITNLDSTVSLHSARPSDLVGLAYQGFLEEQGIPKFNGLTDGYIFGRITAENLVQAGIDADRLPANTVDNTTYMRQVDFYLQSISNDQDDT